MDYKVVEIFSAKKGQSGLPRPKTDKLELLENYGIKDDKFAGKELDRSVMIVGLNSYDIAKEHSIELELGSYGENILLNFDPHTLPFGTKLIIGEAMIEITDRCTLCSHLSIFHKHLPKIIKNHRGIYCKVIKEGTILKDSPVQIDL